MFTVGEVMLCVRRRRNVRRADLENSWVCALSHDWWEASIFNFH